MQSMNFQKGRCFKRTLLYTLAVVLPVLSTAGRALAAPTPTLPIVTATPTPAQTDYSKVIGDLEEFIPQEMDKEHVKGLTIALVDGDRVVWVKGFGYANVDKKIPADGDTLYHLGGVSKAFTAAEVLKLIEQGRVGMDNPIGQYLPGFSIHSRFKKAKAITVRSLLDHHSGLPGFFLKGIWVDQPEDLKQFVKDLKSDYLVAPPQTLYKYSYVDYDLLGRMVEIKRREDFSDAVKEDLFHPLGMNSSSFGNSSDTDPKLGQGYRHGDPVTLIHLRDIPAAGMVSSANDLAKFLRFVLGGGHAGPLGRRSVAALFKPACPLGPLDFGHQVSPGWMLSGIDIPGSQGTAWRDGEYPPYTSQVAVLYKQGIGLALLSNCAEGDGLQGDVTERALKLMLAAKYGIAEDLSKKKIEMPKVVQVPKEQLEEDSGFYSALGQLMKIEAKEDRLGANWEDHQLDLLPVSQDTFVPHITFIIFPVDLPQYPLTFSTVGDQEVAVLGGLTFPVPLQKIKPVEIPPAWKAREGDYEPENPDGVFQFSRISLGEKDGFLLVDMKVTFNAFDIKDKEFKVALLPMSGADALVPGLFYGDGGTLHVAGDDPTRIYYSGYWYRKKPGPGTPTAEK